MPDASDCSAVGFQTITQGSGANCMLSHSHFSPLQWRCWKFNLYWQQPIVWEDLILFSDHESFSSSLVVYKDSNHRLDHVNKSCFLQVVCCCMLSVSWILVTVLHSKLSYGVSPVLGRGCYFLSLHHIWYPGTVFKGIYIGFNGVIYMLCLMITGVLTVKCAF